MAELWIQKLELTPMQCGGVAMDSISLIIEREELPSCIQG